MTAHEFIEGFYKFCGAMAPGSNCLCLDRPTPLSGLRPEPARRQFASEDFDVIGVRLAELAKERQDILNTPDPNRDLLDAGCY